MSRMQSPRMRKGCVGLPDWPTNDEVKKAELAQLYCMAVRINKLMSPQDPAAGPITSSQKAALAVDIYNFWRDSVYGSPHLSPDIRR
jgi:hypothetical protein